MYSLNGKKVKDQKGNEYYYRENMIVWQNGMITFSASANYTPKQRIKTRNGK